MSYVVSVRRSDDAPITYPEFAEAISGDTAFSVAPDSQGMTEPSFVWTADDTGHQTYFHFWIQEVTIESPSGSALRKLQELARQLDADVYGEEGEILSQVNPLDFEITEDGGIIKWFFIMVVVLCTLIAISWLTE
jgi:hypothetical protein